MTEGLTLKYFVLKPKGDDPYARASRLAMFTYANEIRLHNPKLANDLREWVVSEINNFLTNNKRDKNE